MTTDLHCASTSPMLNKRITLISFVCDTLRVICVFLIVLQHSTQYFFIHQPPKIFENVLLSWKTPLLFHAAYGQSWLFLLSGFFFRWKLQRLDMTRFWAGTRRYIKQRFLRLWPLMFVAYLTHHRRVSPSIIHEHHHLSFSQHMIQLLFFQNTLPKKEMVFPALWAISVDFQLHLLGLLVLFIGKKLSLSYNWKSFCTLLYCAFLERIFMYHSSGCPPFPLTPLHVHLANIYTSSEWNTATKQYEKLKSVPYSYDIYKVDQNACVFDHITTHRAQWMIPFIVGTYLGHVFLQEVKAGKPIFPFLIQRKVKIINSLFLLDSLRSWHASSLPHLWRDPPLSSFFMAIVMYQIVWTRTWQILLQERNVNHNEGYRRERIVACIISWIKRVCVRSIHWIARMGYTICLFHSGIMYSFILGLPSQITSYSENRLVIPFVMIPLVFIILIPLHFLLDRPSWRYCVRCRQNYQPGFARTAELLPIKEKK